MHVELHTHSTESDGAFPPRRVAELVAERDAELWALTDHDTCEGCVEARDAARNLGIEFLPGIEISAYRERSIHVLGLGVDHEAEAVVELGERLRRARRVRMKQMLSELEARGVTIGLERVEHHADGSALSRSHLADALVSDGAVSDRDEAFERYIGAGGPAYVPVGWPSIPEAIDRIHRAGGAAVLAHPGRYERSLDIREWSDAGLDGLEVEHPDHTPEEASELRQLADDLGLVATAGSDFHGREGDDWTPFGDVEMSGNQLERLREAIVGHGGLPEV